MRPNRKRAFATVAVLCIAFNIIMFALPLVRDAVFWVVYAFSLVAVLGQAVLYVFAIDSTGTVSRRFRGFHIVRIGHIHLCLQWIVCALFLILSAYAAPRAWMALIPCVLLLAAALVLIIASRASTDAIELKNIGLKNSMLFIRLLKIESETLAQYAADPGLKAKLKHFAESVRYSDPVSTPPFADIERNIMQNFEELKTALGGNTHDSTAIEAQIDELGRLLHDRNEKCKAFK